MGGSKPGPSGNELQWKHADMDNTIIKKHDGSEAMLSALLEEEGGLNASQVASTQDSPNIAILWEALRAVNPELALIMQLANVKGGAA